MKKLAILVGAIVLTSSTFAQKATLDNPFSLEGVINYNSTAGIDWKAPTIRLRYFVTENIAVRVQIGLGDGKGNSNYSKSYTVYDGDSITGNTGTAEAKMSNWSAQIGGEYHLKGTDRMSPYFALGINFGGGKSSISTSEAAPDTASVAFDATNSSYSKGTTVSTEGKMSMFGIGLGAGMDFYVYENLYLGLELGFSFNSYNYKDKTGTWTETTPVASTTNLFQAGHKETHMGTGAANASFRLGWRF
jgi:opacity protein-like surface antigen